MKDCNKKIQEVVKATIKFERELTEWVEEGRNLNRGSFGGGVCSWDSYGELRRALWAYNPKLKESYKQND